VHACVVMLRATSAQEPTLAAYLVPEHGHTPEIAELRAFLKRQLPEYMLPATFTILDALPLTPNGKVDRRALPTPEHAIAAATYLAPRTPVEAVLADIWREVLGVAQVGVQDDFFDLGGHSLLVMKVLARIQETFKIALPLAELFTTRTIAGLAAALIKAEPAPGRVEKIARVHQQLDQMSVAEMETLLRQKTSQH
jgi:acyl carrier protein